MPGRPDAAPQPAAGPLSRRAVLAGGVAGLGVLAACAGTDTDAPGPATAPATAPPREVSPDVALATLALAEIRAVRRAVSATRRRHPDRTGPLRGVATMHRTHEEALVDAVPAGSEPATSPPAYDVPARPERALRRLRQREEQLLARLDALALDAQSGAFASLLASMGAGVAQRVATWPSVAAS